MKKEVLLREPNRRHLFLHLFLQPPSKERVPLRVKFSFNLAYGKAVQLRRQPFQLILGATTKKMKKENRADKGLTDGGSNSGRPIRKPHELRGLVDVVQILDQPLAGGRLAATVAAFEDDEGPPAAS